MVFKCIGNVFNLYTVHLDYFKEGKILVRFKAINAPKLKTSAVSSLCVMFFFKVDSLNT